ncbi:DUF1330 domain-containing protein [Pseudoduganella sp. RAF53_2]|uniref:DUF1330 domain-containing protein n=1 Tax=unclassified Pseudoduganella TaxID=2637179 RepID=UPI003F982F34
MKKGFWVVAYRSISDPAAVQAYAKAAKPVIERLGGTVRGFSGDEIVVHEAGVRMLTVIVEFDSFEQAKACYVHPDYLATVDILGKGAERDFRIFEGL